MRNKTEYIIRYLILIIFFIILSFTLYPVWNHSVAWGESMFFPYLPENFLRIFCSDPHGWILLSFVEVFTNRYMPVITGLHHQDYMSGINIYFLSVIYFGFVYALLNSFEKYFLRKHLTSLSLILIFPLILIFHFQAPGFWWLNHDLWFYSYNLNPIFPLLLFSQWEKYYVTGQSEFSKKEKIYSGILLFLTATGHEFFRMVFLTTVPLVFILNNIFLPEKYSRKKFVIVYSGLFLLNMALVFSCDFRDWLGSKLRSETECFSLLIPYLKEYCKNVLLDNFFLFSLIVLCVAVLIFFLKNSIKIKKILITDLSLLFSVLIFNIIIIVGNEDYEFAFNHPGVRFITKTMLFFIFLSLAGYIISSDILKKFKNKFTALLFLILSSYCLFHNNSFDFTGYASDNKEFRQKMYICEKLYHKKGKARKIAYLPDVNGMPDFTINEYIYLYDKGASETDYKIVRVKGEIDDYVLFYKKETGEEITYEELETSNFTNMLKQAEKESHN